MRWPLPLAQTMFVGRFKAKNTLFRNQIRTQIDETSSDWDRKKLQDRLTKLVGGVAVLNIGAAAETDTKEIKVETNAAPPGQGRVHVRKTVGSVGPIPATSSAGCANSAGRKSEGSAAGRFDHRP